MCVTEKELDRKGGDYLIVQHGYLIGEHNMITQSCIMGQHKCLINMADCEIGITLSCQPQNWLLVANSEVGNSEYIHYSELPTPLIIVYLV